MNVLIHSGLRSAGCGRSMAAIVDEAAHQPAENGPTIGTHHQPLPAVKTSPPHPATAVNRRGPKSRAGLMA